MKTQATRFLMIVFLTQLLTACFLMDLVKDKPIGERVNDAQIILTAAQASIQSDVLNKIITGKEGRQRYEKVEETNRKLTVVRGLITNGDLELANLKLKVVESSMLNLQKYIHQKALEEK